MIVSEKGRILNEVTMAILSTKFRNLHNFAPVFPPQYKLNYDCKSGKGVNSILKIKQKNGTQSNPFKKKPKLQTSLKGKKISGLK